MNSNFFYNHWVNYQGLTNKLKSYPKLRKSLTEKRVRVNYKFQFRYTKHMYKKTPRITGIPSKLVKRISVLHTKNLVVYFANCACANKLNNRSSYHSGIQWNMGGMISSSPEDIVTSSEVLNNEIHANKKCTCKRRCLKHNGRDYYIFYRKCVCGMKSNRTAPTEGSELPAGDINIEGIDIHGSVHCRFIKLSC